MILGMGWSATERGNTWVMTLDFDCNHRIFITLTGNFRLAIFIDKDSTPGVNVKIVEWTDAELAGYINDNCMGWHARKVNVDGVLVDVFGTIVDELEDEDE